MKPSITVVFVFNHKFERNMARLEEYYGPRFSKRLYVMPFSESADPKVISVSEASWYFGGHIAQAAARFIDDASSHYVFIADDLILNPRLNEENLIAAMNLPPETGYIKSLVSNEELRYRWPWAADAAAAIRKFGNGFNYAAELPPAAETQAHFESLGFRFPRPVPRTPQQLRAAVFGTKPTSAWTYAMNLLMTGKRAAYPLLAGYSDFLVVPGGAIRRFTRYCGIFTAMNVFAEVAIPTALAMACDHVMTELAYGNHFVGEAPRRNPDARLQGLELWGQQIPEFGATLGNRWDELLRTFPEHRLYTHPVKLSQWK